MPPWVSDEMVIRLTVFGAAFLLLALIEIAARGARRHPHACAGGRPTSG